MFLGAEAKRALVAGLVNQLDDPSDHIKAGYSRVLIDKQGRLVVSLSATEVDELYGQLLQQSDNRPKPTLFGAAHLLACALVGGGAGWVDPALVAMSMSQHAGVLPVDLRLVVAAVLHEDLAVSSEATLSYADDFAIAVIVITSSVLCDLIVDARAGVPTSEGSTEKRQWASVIKRVIGGGGGIDSAVRWLRELE